MHHFMFDVDDRQQCVEIVLDQTSKESIIECAHDSGGLIGSCTSSRENCECGWYFIIEEPSVGEDSYGGAAYLAGSGEELVNMRYVHRWSSSWIWRRPGRCG